MAVSEERIDELLEDMLNKADEDGWCHIPEDLSDEEQEELSKRLTIITMQDRIDTLLEGILSVIKYMGDIKDHIDKLETMDKLKIKGGLATIKEDVEGLLMDLHSEDVMTDFFRIEVVVDDEDANKEDVDKAIDVVQGIIKTDFVEQLDKLKGYCKYIISFSNKITDELDGK